MNKILEFGRTAMFYVRVLSGYEERRIRSYRLQLQQRLQQAQAKKAALEKVPDQIIISEVRRMVEEMQTLNKKLDDAEVEIENYLAPIDKAAENIMKGQLEAEEENMKQMMEIAQRQALLEKDQAETLANSQALLEKDQADTLANSQAAKAEQQPECADKTARTGEPL